MRLTWPAILIAAVCGHAASVDFAVSVPLDPTFDRYGADPQGNILLATAPSSCTLPVVHPLYACGPIWVGKLDATGQTLVFATYLGAGSAASVYTAVAGIAADAQGNVIVAAHTTTQNMPTTAGAFQTAPKSTATNLYIAKLAPDGSKLEYATYFGGTGGQTALSLAVDGGGSAYIAVSDNSTDFPTTAQSVDYSGLYSTAIVKLDPSGALLYSAIFPFEFYSDVKPVSIDATGHAVLVSNLEALIMAPDGSSFIRATYPQWATISGPCIADATSSSAACGETPWALPRSDGGLQFAGSAASGVPATENAMQYQIPPNGRLRIQNGEANQTPFPQTIAGFAVDPKNPNNVYAATGAGLYLSTDNGSTFSLIRGGPCLAIAVDPFDSNRLYLSLDAVPSAGQVAQVYRSTDGGATWTSVLSATNTSERITSLSADPNIQGLIYGAGPYLFRTTDGGGTWTSQSVGPSMQNQSPSASTSTKSQFVQVDPTHAGWAYVVGINNCIGICFNIPELSQTQDGGNTWTTPVSSPALNSSPPLLVAVDPNSGDVIELAGGNPLIYQGGSFSSPRTLYAGAPTGVAFDAAHPGTIYLAVQITQGSSGGYFIVESTDDGYTWNKLLQLDRPVYNLTVTADGVLQVSQDPNPPQGYFLTTDHIGNVTYGTFFGAPFTVVNTMVSSAAGANPAAIVAGSTEGGLPLVNAAQSGPAGGTDGFLSVFGDNGTLLWSTYLGGSANDSIDWAFPLADGSVIVAGSTSSTDFPLLHASPLGAGNTFLAHLRP